MGMFTDQTVSLAESVVASRRDCILAVKDIKAQAAGMMSEFGRAQANMAHQLKSTLAAGCSARTHQVDSTRRENREDQRRMGRDLRRRLAQATNQISISVASLRAACSKEHAAMAKAQQEQFAKDGQARSKDCRAHSEVNGRLMSELIVSRQNMAQALSRDLESFALGIRNGTDVMLGGFRQAHGEMAGQLRGTLSTNTATLRGHVTELKRGFNDGQNVLRDDMQAARQIWNNRNGSVSAMPGQAAQAAGREVSGGFGMVGKAMEKLGFGARAAAEAADHPETEEKSQPRKHWSKMSDEEKVLQVVRENPNGISATQIGERVSLHAMAVGKIMKELIEKREAQRDDGTRLYTPSKGD